MKSGHEGKTYEVHGPDTLTGEGIARIYSKHLGREIRYQRRRYRRLGGKVKGMMPEFLIADMRIMYEFFQDNGMIATKDDLANMEKLLGHKPRTFDDFVKEITKEWKSTVAKAA